MKRTRYDKSLPRRMYSYFATYSEALGAPSFGKFARSAGITLAELNSFRKHRVFDEAYTECSEIRRDYLIDNALTRKFDPSFVKYLLDSENGNEKCEEELSVRLEVIE